MNRRAFAKSVAITTVGFSFFGFRRYQSAFPIDELLGRVEPTMIGEGFRMRTEAAQAFMDMQADAAKVGIKLSAESSYRSYQRQEQIWTRKYTEFTGKGLTPTQAIDKIIEYSTIPGTSRHHWGTEADVIDRSKPLPPDPLLADHFRKGGLYENLKQWLDENKESYGFYEVYTNAAGRKGFKYEPWHLSYKPISQPILKAYLEIDLKSMLQQIKLVGSEHFTDAFITRYQKENICDINPALL